MQSNTAREYHPWIPNHQNSANLISNPWRNKNSWSMFNPHTTLDPQSQNSAARLRGIPRNLNRSIMWIKRGQYCWTKIVLYQSLNKSWHKVIMCACKSPTILPFLFLFWYGVECIMIFLVNRITFKPDHCNEISDLCLDLPSWIEKLNISHT